MSVTFPTGSMEHLVAMIPLLIMNRLSVMITISIHHSSTLKAKRSTVPSATYQRNDCASRTSSDAGLTSWDSTNAQIRIPTVCR